MKRAVNIVAAGSAVAFILVVGYGSVSADDNGSKYLGSRACKNCHQHEKSGAQYQKWLKLKHAKAYKTLKTPEAIEVAAKRGVTNPHKSAKCLKCHVTAYGVDRKRLARKFKESDGVQCESCHGPGETHRKARIAAAMKAEGGPGVPDVPVSVSPGEIVAHVEETVCVKCHNSESPNFEGFDFEKYKEKIAHPDPRKTKSGASD